jgi:predicted short-subunit dehydrogenase-like oxidoreductase (DUF2520 family)
MDTPADNDTRRTLRSGRARQAARDRLSSRMMAEAEPAPLTILGRGRVGRSLAGALRGAGLEVALEPAREMSAGWVDRLRQPPYGLVVLAVPDGAISELAATLAAARLPTELAFAHVSGGQGLTALAPLARRGHQVGSLHPLQPFPAERPPSAFAGILIAVDASAPELLGRLEALARRVGGRPRRVRERERAAYHAAAVLAANDLVALAAQSSLAFQAAGWSPGDALSAVLSLMDGALSTLAAVGIPQALSGPVRRGDAETIARHVAALAAITVSGARAQPVEVYRLLGLAATDLAVACGLDAPAARRVERALTDRQPGTTRSRGQ